MVAAKGVVSTIVDGETLIVSGVGNVRLAGIRALRDPSRKPRPDDDLFGDEAERAVRRLAAGHNVRLEIESPGSDSAVPLSRTSADRPCPPLPGCFWRTAACSTSKWSGAATPESARCVTTRDTPHD
jgi:hypothetical protein